MSRPPIQLVEHARRKPRGRRILVAALIAIVLSAISMTAKANSIREWLQLNSFDPVFGFSVGRTSLETPFEHSRFAFPDMAQGGPGCCDMTYTEDRNLPAFRISVSDRISGAWGYEGALAYLGKSRVAFDVSGPFGGSLQGPVNGRCVEHGDFTMAGLSLAGTYTKPLFGFEVFGKAGMAANWLNIKTSSTCWLVTQVDIEQDTTRFSMSPLVGAGIRKNLGNGYALTLGAELRRVTFSTNDEAKMYGQGKALVGTVWAGLEF